MVSEITSSAIKIFEHVGKYATFYTMIVKSNALPGFHFRISNELKVLFLHDLADSQPNARINNELHASYQAYAILGMIMEWVNGGFKYSSSYMAEIIGNPTN